MSDETNHASDEGTLVKCACEGCNNMLRVLVTREFQCLEIKVTKFEKGGELWVSFRDRHQKPPLAAFEFKDVTRGRELATAFMDALANVEASDVSPEGEGLTKEEQEPETLYEVDVGCLKLGACKDRRGIAFGLGDARSNEPSVWFHVPDLERGEDLLEALTLSFVNLHNESDGVYVPREEELKPAPQIIPPSPRGCCDGD